MVRQPRLAGHRREAFERQPSKLRVDVLALVVSVISLVFAGWTGLRGLQLADRQS
jgi:hypothetical protein